MAFTESQRRHSSLWTASSLLPSSLFEPWSQVNLSVPQPEAFALANVFLTQTGNPILQDTGPSILVSTVAS
jgi:hypothetical protein